MNWAAIVWFVLMLVFLIVEGICAIHMVSLWFAAGSLAAMLIALLKGPMWLQVTLFIVVSCALLVLFLPFVKKFLNPTRTKTNVVSIALTASDISILSRANADVIYTPDVKYAS